MTRLAALRRFIPRNLGERLHLIRAGARRLTAAAGHAGWWLAQRGQLPDGCVWTRHDGRLLAATPVTTFSSTSATEAVLTAVHGALATAGVPHVVRRSRTHAQELRVAAKDLDRAVVALAKASHSSPLYALSGSRVHLLAPTLRRRHLQSPATVFAAWASPAGAFVAGPDAGINLIAAPTGRVSVTESEPVQGAEPLPTIDAVYTWVAGTDPAWRARKEARLRTLSDPNALHEEAWNPARYEPIDELRYSLRSLEAFAPWIRHVHLVTDRQRPEWLVADNPRLTVVDHRDLFHVTDGLPTFNSHAIETQLHHIDGLAEHYLYFNDDVFLGRAVLPSLFFDEQGRPRVFLAPDAIDPGPPKEGDPPVVVAAKNNRTILQQLTGQTLSHKLKHVPHPQLRSVAAELEQLAPEAFERTARSAFRSPSDISVASSLAPQYGRATGRATLGSLCHFYADVGSPELRWRLGPLLEQHDADVICLNATSTTAASEARRISTFLARYFPLPSGFEE